MPWIFKYIRADREEVDIGLYQTKDDSERGRLYPESLGAIISKNSIEAPEDYKLYKGELKWKR